MPQLLEQDERLIVKRALEHTSIYNLYSSLKEPWAEYLQTLLEGRCLEMEEGCSFCDKPRDILVGSALKMLLRSATKLKDEFRRFEDSTNYPEKDLFRQFKKYGNEGRLGKPRDADDACVGLLGMISMEELVTIGENRIEEAPNTSCP